MCVAADEMNVVGDEEVNRIDMGVLKETAKFMLTAAGMLNEQSDSSVSSIHYYVLLSLTGHGNGEKHIKGAESERDNSGTFETVLIIEAVVVREGYACDGRVADGTFSAFQRTISENYLRRVSLSSDFSLKIISEWSENELVC